MIQSGRQRREKMNDKLVELLTGQERTTASCVGERKIEKDELKSGKDDKGDRKNEDRERKGIKESPSH
jgi:hypothetical protein